MNLSSVNQRLHNLLGGKLDMLLSFSPWIAFWISVGNISLRSTLLLSCFLGLAINGLSLLRHQDPKLLEVGTTAVFLALTVVSFTADQAFLGRWIQPMTNGGLLLIAVVSLLIGRPFTLQYARESSSPEVAAKPSFLFVNKIVTWVWCAAFGVMTGAALIPPIVQGNATLADSTSPISILLYWLIPFSALGLAALFTQQFPHRFTRRA